jgi:hypothetical protein
MESHDKEELTKARATLERQLQIHSNHRVQGSPEAIVKKLRRQLREITRLLESEESDDA